MTAVSEFISPVRREARTPGDVRDVGQHPVAPLFLAHIGGEFLAEGLRVGDGGP